MGKKMTENEFQFNSEDYLKRCQKKQSDSTAQVRTMKTRKKKPMILLSLLY